MAGSHIYLGMLGKQVLALNSASGAIAWEYKGDDPFPGRVTVEDGIAYAPSRGGHVHALDAGTGDLLWKVDTGDPVVAPVAVADGRDVRRLYRRAVVHPALADGRQAGPHPHRCRSGVRPQWWTAGRSTC